MLTKINEIDVFLNKSITDLEQISGIEASKESLVEPALREPLSLNVEKVCEMLKINLS